MELAQNDRDENRDRFYQRSRHQALWAIARGVKPGLINRSILFGLALLALDALAVARFQTSSALSLLRYTPPLTLLVGVMVNVVPVIAIAATIALVLLCAVKMAAGEWLVALRYFTGAIALFFVSNLFLDSTLALSVRWGIALLVTLVVAAGLLMWLLSSHERIEEAAPPLITLLVLGVVLIILFRDDDVRNALARPYLPPELIVINDDGEDMTVVGYVLDVDQSGQWTTLMREGDRAVLIVSSRTVKSREVCTLEPDEQSAPRWAVVEPVDDPGLVPCEGANLHGELAG